MLESIRPRYDVVVVGARCAGAATALLLARQGLRVLAVDRSSHGSDTLSTHGLMRGGVVQLHRWGVLERIVAAGTPPIRSADFHYGDRVVSVPIKARNGIDALYAPRRTLLDGTLADAAAEAGAEVRHRVDVVDLLRSGGRVDGVRLVTREGKLLDVRADLVVGADGRGSRVAGWVGARPLRSGRHATAIVFGYWSGLDTDGYAWHYRDRIAAGAIPTDEGQVCVFVAVPPDRFLAWSRRDLTTAFEGALASAAPSLAAAAARSHRVGALRSFAGAPGFLRRSHGEGWALVGDAGYFKDAITAHGMTDALRDAELLSRAIARGELARYQETRDALSVDMLEAGDAIASFDWDLETLERLHESMNVAMRREVKLLEGLGGASRSVDGGGPHGRDRHAELAIRAPDRLGVGGLEHAEHARPVQ